MKKLSLLLALPAVLTLQNVYAQNNAHLHLSDAYPSPGEKITITYDPSGTPLDDKKDLNAVVYFLDNKDYPAADIDLKPSGKLLKGDFTVPETSKAFFVKFSEGESIDDNNEKGYIYMVYKDKKPVEGAYASKAYVLFSDLGSHYAKIKTNKAEAFKLYNKEFELHPKVKKDYRSQYYSLLSSTKNPEFRVILQRDLQNLIHSRDEKDNLLALEIFNRTKRSKSADSLSTAMKKRFPEGELTKDSLIEVFYQMKNPIKKEELYKAFIEKYPEYVAENESKIDNMRVILAYSYLQNFDLSAFLRLKPSIENKQFLAQALNNIAYKWAKKDTLLAEAATISGQSLDLIRQKISNARSNDFRSSIAIRKDLESIYDSYADSYAFILYKQGKFKEALTYEQPVYEKSKVDNADVNQHYAMMLNAVGDEQKAKSVIEDAIKAGKNSTEMDAALKNIYVKSKGSDAGYNQYFASLKNAAGIATKAKLAKEMINKPAPLFALKDTSGNVVSLASLKGKVVVVDFWATWCGPCKASFPGMQMAVNKFKDDPNVKFLFIDTWENGDNYLPGVEKFITDNKYTFHVLMDEKGEDGRQSKVVSAFGVDGIPTKFILDKNGNIRFKKVGFEGSAEGIRDEVSAMIEMAAGVDLPKSEKVSMVN